MRRMHRFFSLILLASLFGFSAAAQTGKLPRLKKGESYGSLRAKLIKAGWKRHRADDADECMSGDRRCENRPEMQACSGTGVGNCKFLWRRNGKTLAIFTIGDNAVYNGRRFE